MSDLIQSENNLPTNLEQLTVEIKFYVNQWGQNTIEIGKRLIAAKKLVEHGDWGKWLEESFNLTDRTAQRFIKCAERFSNTTTSSLLNPSQVFELLSLPAEETEKFIAAKKAENNHVEDMTVKNLREEVAKWKAGYEQEKSKTENLFHDNENLKSENARLEKIRGSLNEAINDTRKVVDGLIIEKNSLEEQLKNQKPIEKLPDDYEPLKKEREELKEKISQLEKQLKEKPIEVVNPADYEKNKKELAELKTKLAETAKRTEIFQKIDTVCLLWKDIFQSKIGSAIFAEYEKVKKKRYDEFVGSMTDFLRNNNLL